MTSTGTDSETPGCGQPAVWRVEGYSPRDGLAHGSLDLVMYACAEHHEVAWQEWLGEFATHHSSPVHRPPGTPLPQCGRGFDYRTMNRPAGTRP